MLNLYLSELIVAPAHKKANLLQQQFEDKRNYSRKARINKLQINVEKKIIFEQIIPPRKIIDVSKKTTNL